MRSIRGGFFPKRRRIILGDAPRRLAEDATTAQDSANPIGLLGPSSPRTMDHQQPATRDSTAAPQQSLDGWLAELSETNQGSLSLADFYAAFLRLAISAIEASGGAIWAREQNDRLDLQWESLPEDPDVLGSSEFQTRRRKLLNETVAGRKPRMIEARWHYPGAETQPEGRGLLLSAAPLHTDEGVCGVIELFFHLDIPRAERRDRMRTLTVFCERASEYLTARRVRALLDRVALCERLDEFALAAQRSLDSRTTAYSIANEGRRIIGCDRVTVALCRGRRCSAIAVSGIETLDTRSSAIVHLNRLVSAVVASGEDVWHDGNPGALPPQIETALDVYLDVSHARLVAVLPLRPPEVVADDAPSPPVGALVVEQIASVQIDAGFRRRAELVRARSAVALARAAEHEQLFLFPLWRMLGKSLWLVRGRALPKTVAACAAIATAALALVLVPADFTVEGRGTLEPVERRSVFAQVDGEVEAVHVRHGQLVEPGDLLVEMRNVEIDLTLAELRGERNAALEQLHGVQSSLFAAEREETDSPRLSEFERAKLHGQRLLLEQTVRGLDDRIAFQRQKRRSMQVRSPIRGHVVTWDVETELLRRPVSRGEVLLTVADPDREWRLKLLMPEATMGHVLRASLADDSAALPVEFILATDPRVRHSGEVHEIHREAEVRGTDGNTVVVHVAIDEGQLENPYPGALVTAKVHCGRRSLGYVWFHDLVSFVQSRVFFRFL